MVLENGISELKCNLRKQSETLVPEIQHASVLVQTALVPTVAHGKIEQ